MAITITYYNLNELVEDGSLTEENVTCIAETFEEPGYGLELIKGQDLEFHLREKGYEVSLPEWYDKLINIS
jgi:hypothetical protein